MDAHRFDTLIATLSRRSARRGLIAALGSGLLASKIEREETTAAKSGNCKQTCGACEQCKQGKCRKTKSGKKRCKPGTCQPQANGIACGNGGVCQNGTCGCPAGTVTCSGACVRGTCCLGTPCSGANCQCTTATEGDTFCVNNNIASLCVQCPNAGCTPGTRCEATTCGPGVTAVCRPICAP